MNVLALISWKGMHQPCRKGRRPKCPSSWTWIQTGAAPAGAHAPQQGTAWPGGWRPRPKVAHIALCVSTARFREVRESGATTLAVACPFCMIMLGDASAAAGGEIVVRDVAAIVAEALSERGPRDGPS